MNKNLTKRIVTTAVIAAIYAVVTIAISPLSYGEIQFRVSEVLVLLALFDPLYIGGLTLGCFVANILGPNGPMDVLLGTLATFISVIFIYYTGKVIKHYKVQLIIASLWPTIFNGVIIGWMLNMLYGLPLVLTILQVAIGEFVVITIIGVPLFISSGSTLKKLISNNL